MKKAFIYNTNTRVPAQLVEDTGTRENTAGIRKVKMYQNVITATNLEISRTTDGRESERKIK